MSRQLNRRTAFFAVVFCLCIGSLPEGVARAETVRIMSFNLWHGGDAGQQPLKRTIDVIRAAKADVVGLQETHGHAPEGKPRPDRAAEIASQLGWHYVDQGQRTGIISRHPITGVTSKKWGVKVTLNSARELYVFNCHLAASPYQPYQLLKIPYGDAPFIRTEAEAIRYATKTRGAKISRMLSEIEMSVPDGISIAVTGDFNEPSCLDWTDDAATQQCCPIAVRWPTTRRVLEFGLLDTYREAHPSVVEHPGITWTPTTKASDPNDRHDRIDFVFWGRNGSLAGRVVDCQTVGESSEHAEIVVEHYPSDHRAVVAEIEFPEIKEAK